MPLIKDSRGTVKREDFVRGLVNAGLSYAHAEDAYRAVMTLIEDAIVQKRCVVLRDAGKLTPKLKQPRTVVMGMTTQGGKMQRARTVYNLGHRVSYKFALSPAFSRRHGLRA